MLILQLIHTLIMEKYLISYEIDFLGLSRYYILEEKFIETGLDG